jgi:hypothetical protein
LDKPKKQLSPKCRDFKSEIKIVNLQIIRMTGLVYKSTGSWYTKIEQQGGFYRMPYEREIRIKGIKSTNPLL